MSPSKTAMGNILCVKLLQLRRHFDSCPLCHVAIKGHDYTMVCDEAKEMLIEVAIKWNNNIPGRLAAHNSGRRYIYPCPDPRAHGAAYQLTAEALIVEGTQDRLF